MKMSMLSLAGLAVACVAAVAFAQDKSTSSLHYAYHCVDPSSGEQMMMNWSGTISWNSRPHRDELLIQQGKDIRIITDKAVLDEMKKATQPLRATVAGGEKERSKVREKVYSETNRIVANAIEKDLGASERP